ncbi:MAG: alcohol dehydrogenase catalytic domain-containing protein [Spirochaetales bacterium]|nr:alcohol dehydrogenase catalytic domain-containing protein [Spirochaetales bacterium]
MKAARLVDRKKIEICDIPPVSLRNETDVLVKVGVAGICGSDIHYYENGNIGEQVISFPQILGHEMSGTVVAVASGVNRVSPGDRVAIDPAVSCFSCDQCKAGRPHTCRSLKFLGCPGQLEGCYTEYVVMPQESCYPVPDSMPLEIATICEPLSIGYYAVQSVGDVTGRNIGILGAGPIGLSVMLVCLMKGAGRTYVTDLLDYRCDIARKHGASWTGNPNSIDVVSEIGKHEPLQLDFVFECCGKQEALEQALLLLKPGGTLAVIGIPGFSHYRFQADMARRKEICIRNIRRQNECTGIVIDAVASGNLDPGFMITHRFQLEEISRAFSIVSGYRENVVKAMIAIA